jgi:hypothetical protein
MQDVRCWRDEKGIADCSLPQRHKHHSPTGFEFGYGGSGPADLALNILALAIGPPPDPGPAPDEETATAEEWEAWAAADEQRVKLWDGSSVHVDAWDLHEAFKWELIAPMPRAGGTIPGVVIEAWIAAHRGSLPDEHVGTD